MKTRITFFGDNERNISKKSLYALIDAKESSVKILKDDRRSLVFVVEMNGMHYVVKNPRDKNRRLWIRFLTLFRQSETVMALKSMEILLDLRILTTKPIASIEKYLYGMVIEGWMIYEYLEAKPINTSDISKSYGLLCNLHEAGFLHGNPQEQNFLQTKEGEIAIIDSKVKKFYKFTCNDWIEKINFANSFYKQDDRIYANKLIYESLNFRYCIAKFKLALFRFFKKPKYWLRALK